MYVLELQMSVFDSNSLLIVAQSTKYFVKPNTDNKTAI